MNCRSAIAAYAGRRARGQPVRPERLQASGRGLLVQSAVEIDVERPRELLGRERVRRLHLRHSPCVSSAVIDERSSVEQWAR